MGSKIILRVFVMAAIFLCGWILPGIAAAHCDTLDGPVVATARAALEKADVTPVLKWVRKDDEKDIRVSFDRTLVVRKQGKEARELADMYFFETLVRIHRAGEGAPYTGLKAAGAVDPSVAAADRALESGSVDSLVKMVNDAASKGIRERFERSKEARKHADHTIEAGRAFVGAYVEFTHYVERLYMAAERAAAHGQPEGAAAPGQHQH